MGSPAGDPTDTPLTGEDALDLAAWQAFLERVPDSGYDAPAATWLIELVTHLGDVLEDAGALPIPYDRLVFQASERVTPR